MSLPWLPQACPLRIAVPWGGEGSHNRWPASLASGCGLRPPTACREQEQRADPDTQAAQGCPLFTQATCSHNIPSSVFAACPAQVTVGTQVWTLTVSEAIVGGKQRGPSGSPRRHSGPWSSFCRIQAVPQVWEPETVPAPPGPRTPARRARRPTASRLCKADRTSSGWTWDFSSTITGLVFSSRHSCRGPFDSRLCRFLLVSQVSGTASQYLIITSTSPKLLRTRCFVCTCLSAEHVTSVVTHWHLRAFPDQKGLFGVDTVD